MSANPPFADFPAAEPYVSAERVAEHLAITRRQVLSLTRSGKLPAHAIKPDAVRKIYRFKLSEVDAAISQKSLATNGSPGNNDKRQPRDRRG